MRELTRRNKWMTTLTTMTLLTALGAGPALAHEDPDGADPYDRLHPAVDPPPDECPDPAPGGGTGGAARLIAAGMTLVVRLATL